jgi:hypothetical protein
LFTLKHSATDNVLNIESRRRGDTPVASLKNKIHI